MSQNLYPSNYMTPDIYTATNVSFGNHRNLCIPPKRWNLAFTSQTFRVASAAGDVVGEYRVWRMRFCKSPGPWFGRLEL
ncbi:hypothetical protein D9758_008802 [Tetrapyrgos nigripes]|uniref:Uncharacterized protein n=1 Tax=Tetrapyrgos nigripes TaxID=182062 RepID=A0A8H5D428_9AGAR|nr:hypothetical protein D9758_008802 [Tetrapyrgos nigripes]